MLCKCPPYCIISPASQPFVSFVLDQHLAVLRSHFWQAVGTVWIQGIKPRSLDKVNTLSYLLYSGQAAGHFLKFHGSSCRGVIHSLIYAKQIQSEFPTLKLESIFLKGLKAKLQMMGLVLGQCVAPRTAVPSKPDLLAVETALSGCCFACRRQSCCPWHILYLSTKQAGPSGALSVARNNRSLVLGPDFLADM